MPIRLNLLAEAQTAEEQRRRDPVKRVMWICGFLVVLVLAGSGFLQWKIMRSNKTLEKIESSLAAQETQYKKIIENQKRLADVTHKLVKLNDLATNRFLWGSLLDGLQKSTIADIQLLRLKSDQIYDLSPEAKARTNDVGKLIPAKPATVTERLVLTFDAKDSSQNPGGEQMNRFREGLQTNEFFKVALGKANDISLKTYSVPQFDTESGKAYVLFSLQCALPEKVYK